ncbi:Alpha/Beta hydrolase protein [Phyllosticta citrichinensis]|uniref:Alpha/Beta hydrolase protein n=1 Tax=Phyllosticta citrichinensis TaxID=1130410 RepID=A0ABR1Y5E9_9PEZI
MGLLMCSHSKRQGRDSQTGVREVYEERCRADSCVRLHVLTAAKKGQLNESLARARKGKKCLPAGGSLASSSTTHHGIHRKLRTPPNPPPHRHRPRDTAPLLPRANAHQTPNTPPTILLIHGNSSCSLSFHRLLTHLRAHSSPLTAHRTLLLDLPGHGASTDAPHPEASYTQPAYTAAALDAQEALGCLSGGVVVLGWSLGWHVAVEMVAADSKRCVKGVMIVGTPPALGEAQVAAGFLQHPPPASKPNDNGEEKEDEEEGDRMLLASQETWPASAFSTFPYAAIGEPRFDWIRSAAH